MADADLLFKQPAAADGHLVFGATGGGGTPDDVDAVVLGVLPGPSGAVVVRLAFDATISGTLPKPTGVVVAQYRSNTDRPLAAATGGSWREGTNTETGVDATFLQRAQRSSTPYAAAWAESDRRQASSTNTHRDAARTARTATVAPWRESAPRDAAPATGTWRNGDRSRRVNATAPWREGVDVRQAADFSWRNGDRTKRLGREVIWRDAEPLPKGYESRFRQRGARQHRSWDVLWRNSIRPPAGTTVVEPPEPPHVCYVPSAHLLFKHPWTPDAKHLLFSCEEPVPPGPVATVVVPIQRVYMLLNSATLTRVEGNVPIFTPSVSLSLDVDSWAWSFSAAVPMSAQELVEPNEAGDPVELEVVVNGVAIRLLAETLSREREFYSMPMLRVSGRSKIALLDAKYAAVMNFNNEGGARTLSQLMTEALEISGVGIGWGVDFGPEDWLVPAGLWNHQGTHISALNTLAAAAGAYVQPHNTSQTVRILPRYPVAPWDWGSVTPDYELPAAVTTRESISWDDKPVYNRVFVVGQGTGGIKGRVTRAGSDGSLVAPMVVDPLITTAAAARQRGLPILADVGTQADVSLRLGVLSSTGLILPGKFVRYVDGAKVRLGITRRLGVEVSGEQIWQTIGVQTYGR